MTNRMIFDRLLTTIQNSQMSTIFLVAGIIFQVLSIPSLWLHTSSVAEILDRYSTRYFAVLLITGFVLILWIVLFIKRAYIQTLLRKIPSNLSRPLLLMMTLTAFLIWMLPVEEQLLYWASGTLLSIAVLFINPLDTAQVGRWWLSVGFVLLLVLLGALFITSIGGLEYSPDESIWADVGGSFFIDGTLNRRTVADVPPIIPGIGWVNALHGLLLNISFDIRMGRFLRFAIMLLAILTLSGVAWRYAGRNSAYATLVLAICGSAFFRFIDYRPDHFVVFAQGLAFLMVGMGFQATRRPHIFHFLAGLIITLSLQFHAIGIAFAFGFSIFYLIVFIIQLLQPDTVKKPAIMQFMAYVSGAFVGTAIYYFANIVPVGGIGEYLRILVSDRYGDGRQFRYLLEQYPVELMLYLGGLILLLLRRNKMDRIFIGLVVCSAIGGIFFDTPGYFTPYMGMLVMSGGFFLGRILDHKSDSKQFSAPQVLLFASIIIVVTAPTVFQRLDSRMIFRTLQTGQLPEHRIMHVTQEAARYVEDDEVVVGINEFIWGLWDHPLFYNTMLEKNRLRSDEWGEGIEVWRNLNPDVILDLPARLPLTENLQLYMQEEGFEVCQTILSSGYEVSILKRECTP